MVVNTRNTQSHIIPPPLRLAIAQGKPAGWGAPPQTAAHWDVDQVTLGSLLDHVQHKLENEPDSTNEAMEELMSGLWALKSSVTPEAWQKILCQCIDHPIRGLIHQDPFTARSFQKPRGYAGDAVLIDFIYSGNCRLSESDYVSPLGETIFRFNRDTPACAAVRARRDLVASMIDEVCAVIDHPNILSVACGHLREATLCRSVTSGASGRFVALDQDELSLGTIEQEVRQHGVVPVCSSIKSLFRGEIAREQFDFIYSTGLYDYLDDRIGTKLTSRLFDMLNPGGRLLVANFLPNIWGAGYMESFMDWKLIYRTADQINAMASEIAPTNIASRRTFTERHGNIVFLDLVRQ